MKKRVIIGILVLEIIVILFTDMVLAQPTQGDWIVTGEEVVENEIITLNGNLIVKNSGKLTLRNVTLTIDNSYTNQYGISAEPGSSIFIYNSILSSSNLEYKFSFEVEKADFVIKDSELHGMGYAHSILEGSFGISALTIKNCQNIIIENNHMEHINSGAINLIGVTDSIIKNNNIVTWEEQNDPYPGGIFLSNSKNNKITNNFLTGIYTGMYFFDASGNYIANNELLPGTAGHLGQGITLDASNNNVFVNNKISGQTGCTGFRILTSNNNLIKENNVKQLRFGAIVSHSSGNIIANNNFSEIYEYDAVLIYRSQENFVINNDISLAVRGITLSNFAHNNIIQSNIISAIEQEGISLYFSSDDNTITENKVFGNKKGILVHGSSKNTIYNNNFIENNQQGYDDESNNWNFEGIGNYWSDYKGNDGNDDGIGDTSYSVPPNGADNYPLMTSKSIVLATIPEQGVKGELKYELPWRDITDEMKIENQEMLLENSLAIKNGGKLILDNVILSSPKTASITVEAGGSLYIYNSKITAPETGELSIFISALYGSTLVLKNSELHHIDGGLFNPGPSGAAITILGADITIENNVITDSRVGVSLGWTPCSGSIVNNTYSNVLFPLEGKSPDSNLKIQGNIIHDEDILPLQYVSGASWSPWSNRKAPESDRKAPESDRKEEQAQIYFGFNRFIDNVKMFFSSGDRKIMLALDIREKELNSAIINTKNGDDEKAEKNLERARKRLQFIQNKVSKDIAEDVKSNIDYALNKINEEENLLDSFETYVLEEEKTWLIAKLVIEVEEKEGQTLTREIVKDSESGKNKVEVVVKEDDGQIQVQNKVMEIKERIDEIDNQIADVIVKHNVVEGGGPMDKDNDDVTPEPNTFVDEPDYTFVGPGQGEPGVVDED